MEPSGERPVALEAGQGRGLGAAEVRLERGLLLEEVEEGPHALDLALDLELGVGEVVGVEPRDPLERPVELVFPQEEEAQELVRVPDAVLGEARGLPVRLETPRELAVVDREPLGRGEHHALRRAVDAPQARVGEDLPERGEQYLHRVPGQGDDEPLAEDASGLEAALHELVELPRVERPRVERLGVRGVGDDDGVPPGAEEERVPPVVHDPPEPRVPDHVAVLAGEDPGHAGHVGVEVHHLEALHVVDRRPRRHAGPECDHQALAGAGVDHGRQDPQHLEELHVPQARRGLLDGVEVEVLVAGLEEVVHHDVRDPALLVVQDAGRRLGLLVEVAEESRGRGQERRRHEGTEAERPGGTGAGAGGGKDGEECGEDVQADHDHEPAVEAHLRNEDEARGEAAEDRARRVHGVDRADRGALAARAALADLHGEGHGDPHQDGGREHDDGGLGEGESVGLAGEERALEELEQEGRRPGPQADAELERGEQEERPAGPGEKARVDEASQGDPGQEGREHGGEGVDVVVQEQVEHPRPQQLVGQGAEAGEPDPRQHQPHGEAVVRGSGRRRPGGRRRSCPGRAGLLRVRPPQEPRRRGHAEVDGDRHLRGAAHPQGPEEHVPGREAADDRARGVQAVEEPGLATEGPVSSAEPLQQDGERPSHEERGGEHEAEADREPDQVEERDVALQAEVERRVDRRRPGEQQREHEGEGPDPGFQQRVERHQRPRTCVDEAAERVAAGRQSPHVGGDHGAGREQGVAEDQAPGARVHTIW